MESGRSANAWPPGPAASVVSRPAASKPVSAARRGFECRGGFSRHSELVGRILLSIRIPRRVKDVAGRIALYLIADWPPSGPGGADANRETWPRALRLVRCVGIVLDAALGACERERCRSQCGNAALDHKASMDRRPRGQDRSSTKDEGPMSCDFVRARFRGQSMAPAVPSRCRLRPGPRTGLLPSTGSSRRNRLVPARAQCGAARNENASGDDYA
jgi:hypothetical protein